MKDKGNQRIELVGTKRERLNKERERKKKRKEYTEKKERDKVRK